MQPLTMNLCNLPPWVIAAPEFNANPKPIEIQGVRRAHRFLFERLATMPDPQARAKAFLDHMDVAFQLHQWEQETSALGRKSLKNSYLRFLRGWMFDANSLEGAVLKGWVESRIGIPPTFHKEAVGDVHSATYAAYLADRMRGSARTSAIQAQFDLLYEFVQEELRRREEPPVCILFRGIHDFSEHRVLDKGERHRMRLRLNNLNSFTPDFERAFEFGTKVLEVQVPSCKVFFRADLLPGALLKGEEEVMVIGGDFDVIVRTG
ncbi:MAG TPA: NAD(+)--dinitrogen-reductase ADP-D-ribosyltransferase [Candidatus Deferrimicrobiaceae bacterium]